MLSACLTCKHARKTQGCGLGQAFYSLSLTTYQVMHVCFDFEPLKAFQDVECFQGFKVAVVSTTATNSPSGTIRGENQ